jgi:uncharacterized membrane protein
VVAAAGLAAAAAMVALPVSAPLRVGARVVDVSCGAALTVALEGSPSAAYHGPLAARRRGDCAEQAVRRLGWAGLVVAVAVVPPAVGGAVASGRARRRQLREAGLR